MEYKILGPLEVTGAHGAIDIGRGSRRVLLSALLLHAGTDVSPESLADAVWRGAEPASWAKSLQMHVVRLRSRIGPERITTSVRGYRLIADPGSVDAERFAAGLRLPASERGLQLDALLALWRGRPYDDLGEWPPAVAARATLNALHAEAVDAQLHQRVEAGTASIADVERSVEEAPEREQRWALLMYHLYRSGRQAEALRTFDRARTMLTENFGVEPGAALVALHRAMLDQDPRLDAGGVDLGTAGLRDDPAVPNAALEHSRRAGAHQRAGDPGAALVEFEAALATALEHESDPRAVADLWLDVAEAARTAGDPARAVVAAEAAARAARLLGDAARLARAALVIAGDGWLTGIDPEARPLGLLDEALDQLGDAPSPLRARLLARRAVARSHSRPFAAGDRDSAKAVALARVLAEPETTAIALHARLVVDQDIARLGERDALAQELIALADRHGTTRWWAWAVPALARIRALRGEFGAAIALLDSLAAYADADHDPVAAYHAESRHVLAATVAGDYPAAERAAAAVRDAGVRALMDPTAAGLAYFGTIGILQILQDEDTDVPFGDDIEWPQDTMHAAFRAAIAMRALAADDPQTARRALAPLTVDSLAALPRDLYWPSLVWMMAVACRQLEDRERARALAKLAAPFAEVYIVDGGATFLGCMAHHLGLLTATAGDDAAAAAYFRAAVEAHRAADAPTWLAASERELAQLTARVST